MTVPSTSLALARAVTRWGLADATLVAETGSSVVYKVLCPEGAPAALKLLRDEAGGDEARGGELLAWYAGEGAVEVYGISEDAVLMQWLAGETLGDLARAGEDELATGILCDVVGRLQARRDRPPPELMPLRRRFEALFHIGSVPWPPSSRPLVARAMAVARELLDGEAPAQPLHGDIHHDNVLRSGRDWVAIDPKGLLGEAAYDYANSFGNPERAAGLVIDRNRVERHATTISERTGISRRRLLGWAVAHTALSGAWHIEDGNAAPHQAALLALLVPAYDAA